MLAGSTFRREGASCAICCDQKTLLHHPIPHPPLLGDRSKAYQNGNHLPKRPAYQNQASGLPKPSYHPSTANQNGNHLPKPKPPAFGRTKTERPAYQNGNQRSSQTQKLENTFCKLKSTYINTSPNIGETCLQQIAELDLRLVVASTLRLG